MVRGDVEEGGEAAHGTSHDETSPSALLLPYVPRLVVQWAAGRPGDRWQPVAGTMVFADLSGFTAMSERLSRLGRVGAEEVTDAISTCFFELLRVAYDAGGGLLKFGGDALLLAFTGSDHERRAVWAAAVMRERLRTVGRIQTPAGAVRLRMSVGVHSGTFDCFLVGAPSRELLVAGAAASEVVTMEHDASAGQIVLSPATSAALPPACVGTELGRGCLLKRAPDAPALRDASFEGSAEVDLRDFVPAAVHDHLVTGGGSAEHRTVTVAFVAFSGIDARLSEHGPGPTAAALDELVTTVERACAHQDVALLATDVDVDGGKFLLAAGAPSARAHDEERMLAAAREIADAGLEIPVCIGVHRGAVFAGDVGPPYRRTYTVMGDTVNLAARLMAAAAPGQVVTTAAVLDRAPGFAATPLPPMAVKGKRAPVEAFIVGDVRRSTRARDTSGDASRLPFVGRDEELAALERRVVAARAGRGSFVRVVGPAGIGKSRLASELRRRAADVPVVQVTCEAYEVATPYAAVWQLLGEAIGRSPDASATETIELLFNAVDTYASHLEPWLPLLGTIFDLDLADTPQIAGMAPEFRAARTRTAAAELLAATLSGPRVVIVDDAEWMDDVSREVAGALRGLVDDAGIVFVSLVREDAPQSGDDETLVLRPLARADVDLTLQRASEDAPLRAHELDAIAGRADGNPLFLTELWHAASGGEAAESLPDSVEALVTEQLDRLSPTLRTFLGYAAVLGRGFSRQELDALAGDEIPTGDSVWHAVTEFVELDGDQAQFRHGLMRDAAYAKLPFRLRRQLHARAAFDLERRGRYRRESEAELLSLHFYAAQRFDEAWYYARIGGDRARAKYANVDAAVLYERALAAARRLPTLDVAAVVAVRESLGDVRDHNGEYERALAAYRAARRLVRGDRVREAELLLKEAWIPERIGRNSDAVRTIRKALRLIDGVDGERAGSTRAQLSAWYAAIRQGQGRHKEAIEWCERAITAAAASDDLAAEAHARFILDWAYAELGRFDLAVHSEIALSLYEQLGDLHGQGGVLNNLGNIAYLLGRWDDAIRLYEDAAARYTQVGAVVDAARASANIGELLSDQGHLDDAETRFVDALRVARAAGYHYDVALATSFLGRNASRAGRHDESMQYLEHAHEEFVATGLTADALRIDVWKAESAANAGDMPAALALAESSRREILGQGGTSPELPLVERVRAVALDATGDTDAARIAITASIAAARARGADYELALSLDALCRMGSGANADLRLTRAERDALFDRLGLVG